MITPPKKNVQYQSYSEIERKIKEFKNHYVIGRDASDKYNIYAVEVGDENKPTLMVMSSIHGTEWQTTSYSLDFMKSLDENTFSDYEFMVNLKKDYRIVYIPVANPYGLDNVTDVYAQYDNKARRNYNGKDLNRDFLKKTQPETKAIVKLAEEIKPFAVLDMHMFQPEYDLNNGKNMVLGYGQTETSDARDNFADMWEKATSSNIHLWGTPQTEGLARKFFADLNNHETPHTLSYITELMRPAYVDGVKSGNLSNETIFEYGYVSLYSFLKTSVEYHKKYSTDYEIVENFVFVRDLEGNEYHLQATVTHELELNGNQSLSFTVLPTKANRKFIGDLSEMWEVIDDKGVVHRIVYCKQKGKGNLKYDYTPEQKESFLSPVQTTQAIDKKRELVKNMTVEVKAIPKFFDDMDNSRIYEEYNEHMPAQRAFSRIFDGMPYQFIIVGQFDAVEWEGFGAGESRLETFKRALNRYKMEFRIEGSIVYLEHQIGRDTQFQYRYRLNASNIVKEIDAGEFWTYARGYGDYEGGQDEGWEQANIQMDYTSPLAKIVGKREAPPIKDGRIKKKSTMEQSLKELVDESLMISISTDIHDLRKQGYALAQPEVGDRVFIVDERIGLDEEIRITDISVTKDWKGNVIDLKLTVGSGNLSKRHQSNLNTAAKELSDVLSGKKTFPYSVLDEAVKNATEVLQNVQTELDFTGSGIIGRDKDNPNYLTLFSGRGIGVSDDGGNTFKEAIIAGKGINASAVVTGTMVADFIAGGQLSSLNGDTYFDLNNGNLMMKQARFELGSGADIEFTSANNRLYYSNVDDEENQTRTSGVGVGRSINDRYPYAFLGTTTGTKQSFDPTDENYFSGFITNTRARTVEDGIGNSVVGNVFHVRDLSVDYTQGFEFNLKKSRKVFRPINTSDYTYDIGDDDNSFDRIFVDRFRTKGKARIQNKYDAEQNFTAQVEYDGEEQMAFYGANTSSKYYNLGKKSNRFSYIYLNYEPDVKSDERLKENIKENNLGLNFINDIETKSFNLINNNPRVKEEPKQYGLTAQQLRETLINHGEDIENVNIISKDDEGYYGIQYGQLTAPIIKSIQELSQRIEQLEAQING